MADAPSDADRAAADWFLWLGEDPGDSALHARFAAWLEADAAHADAWARIAGVGHALATVPAAHWDRPQRWPRRRRRAARASLIRPSRRASVGAVAAAATLLLLTPALPDIALALRADHMTGRAAQQSLTLRDGSRIRLAPDSAIRIDESDGARTVHLLAGRAWFEVVHDPNHPFRVTAGDVTTVDLGTRFEVRLRDDGAEVAVAEGEVRVEQDGARPAVARTLGAGEWLRMGGGRIETAGHYPADLMGPWRDARLTVDNRPIADAIDDLRPWYRGRILVMDGALARHRVTGIYDLSDPARTLESLVYPAGGRIIRITPWLMIVTGR